MSHLPYRTEPIKQQDGIVLLEALIAILIFSLGVLGIVGLQASVIKNTTDAKFRSEASHIAQQRIGQIWADPANAINYLENQTDISGQLPAGTRTVEQPTADQFVITIRWQQPGESQHNFTTTASIRGGI